MTYSYKPISPDTGLTDPNEPKPKAVVIGAGLGGLSAAMRLGSKGYRVQIIDKLDRLGGRGSSISKSGYRFDLGPTILTVPEVFRKLWQDCGFDFEKDVNLEALDPFYEIRWQDGSNFRVFKDETEMLAEVKRKFPGDFEGYIHIIDPLSGKTIGRKRLSKKPIKTLFSRSSNLYVIDEAFNLFSINI